MLASARTHLLSRSSAHMLACSCSHAHVHGPKTVRSVALTLLRVHLSGQVAQATFVKGKCFYDDTPNNFDCKTKHMGFQRLCFCTDEVRVASNTLTASDVPLDSKEITAGSASTVASFCSLVVPTILLFTAVVV